MSSRRRGGNTGNSSPVVTRRYDFRDRTKNVVQQSSVTTSERDPQTPEPRSKGDFSGLVRPVIRNSGKEKKDRTVEQNVRNRSTRRTTKPAEPDIDVDSDDGSNYSNSSRRGLSENDRQSYVLPTIPSSKSNIESSLLRPRIGFSDGNTKKQLSQARQLTEYTDDFPSADDENKTNYYEEETWRAADSTKTPPSQSSSEDDEKETLQHQQKTTDQLSKTTRYKEERGTWRSTSLIEDSVVYHRREQKPLSTWRENTKTQTVQSRATLGFSDDDEEATRYQEKRAAFQPRPVEGVRMNHYPEKKVEQQAKVVRKSSFKSFIHFTGMCMKYLVLLLLVLIVGSAAVFYISPVSFLKMAGQLKFVDEPQIKKDLKDDFEKLANIFPNQSQPMWNRSRRILELHLQNWKGNTEPAIILLTGALDAEQTLLCIGTQLTDIYSSSLNGSYTVISGSDWASGSNEEVKEYIDDKLSAGFQTTTRAAVLHRLELLPAGSLLILYKYCDHESAVFKNVTLLLTVLLEDATLPKDIPLVELEEKVREFLIQKLIDSNTSTSHDGMNKDKFSGVWSRISHVVLPVFPEKNIMEQCVKKQN